MSNHQDLADRLAHAIATASNDDLSKPNTDKRRRHTERIDVMLEAVEALRAALSAPGKAGEPSS